MRRHERNVHKEARAADKYIVCNVAEKTGANLIELIFEDEGLYNLFKELMDGTPLLRRDAGVYCNGVNIEQSCIDNLDYIVGQLCNYINFEIRRSS